MRAIANGITNMSRDLELVEIVRTGLKPIVFETYMWEPWAVSLGKHQSVDMIDLEKAKAMGVDVVWRPTGGRAILHADELTYCVASRGEPRDIYRKIHSLVHEAIERIIPDVLVQQRSPTNLRQFYASGTPMGQACFASSVTDELMHNGKKVVGSAQRIIDGVVLQHGSILCGPSHEGIADLLKLTETERDDFRNKLRHTSISLSEIAGRRINPSTVAEQLDRVFELFRRTSISAGTSVANPG